jgi:dUTPase
MALRLFICPTSTDFEAMYRRAADVYNRTPYAERNSGFDLYTDGKQAQLLQAGCMLVGQGCRALAVDAAGNSRAFWLAPRSSISKTPWRLANSLGLIDATYRGVIRAALDGVCDIREWDLQRLCQLTAGDLLPWAEIIVVDELPGAATVRGEGGFGSTGAA